LIPKANYPTQPTTTSTHPSGLLGQAYSVPGSYYSRTGTKQQIPCAPISSPIVSGSAHHTFSSYSMDNRRRDTYGHDASIMDPNAPTLKLWNVGNSCWIATCVQMLYCAHLRSDKKLFRFFNLQNPVIQRFQILMNERVVSWGDWSDFYTTTISSIPGLQEFRHRQGDAGKFYEIFISYLQEFMTPEAKAMLACSNVRPLTQGCAVCHIEAPVASDNVFFLQYAGSDEFSSSVEFSQEWKHCFEYQTTCEHNRPILTKNYFLLWPKFLFVLASSSRQMLVNANKYPFQIGEMYNNVTYSLIGAAVHSGASQYAGHYTAAVKFNNWYSCNDSHAHRVDLNSIHGDVQLLLFERKG